MIQVTLIENHLEPESRITVEVEDLCAWLAQQWETFPTTARIYHGLPAVENDVTPGTEEEIARLQSLPGPFVVVVYSGDPFTIIVATIAVVAGVAAALLLVPPIDAIRNTQSESPNNALSQRTNQPRINGRIPDIFGTVRSTPDLLALPYKVFKDHQEVEVAYLCVGRGEYEIHDVYDDNTPVSEIAGMQVEVYGPNTSPLSGDAPQMSIGSAIEYDLMDVRRSTAVNGQTLFPPNYKKVVGTDNIRVENRDRFRVRDTSVFVWPQHFEAGDWITVTNGTVNSRNLNGTYQVQSVDNDFMILVNPSAVNGQWALLPNPSSYYGPTIQVSPAPGYVGPFFVDLEAGGYVIANIVALGGLYKQDNDRQVPVTVTIEFRFTPVDESGTATGPSSSAYGEIVGSGTTKSTRAITVMAEPFIGWSPGRYKLEARRTSDTDYDFAGSVVDEIKWRDLYVCNPIDQEHFGDVTTVFAVTYATDGALALKDRKLNMEVTRKLFLTDGSTFDGTSSPTNSAVQIFIAAALDPLLGGRELSEVDVTGIVATGAAIESYFGVPDAGEFNYTFDKANLSPEETLNLIASTAFCTAYRRGNLLHLSFERATEDSVLLFNHRNKTPGSETRTVTFGGAGDYDGVAYEYVSPEDDAIITLYVPQGDDTAVRPRKVESVGVRNPKQAHLHAWRLWNKIQYQNTITEFEATQEADLVLPTERVLVADNTRADVWDGEVMSQVGLELTLSQPFDPGGPLNHSIFLQLYDGTVQPIIIASAGPDPHVIVLDEAPSLALALDEDLYARTTYMIQAASPARPAAFLVSEKDPQTNFTVQLTAINYDERYYANDADYAT